MADMMNFPNTWEEFERFYGFTDTEEIYTNGARIIPSFRVEQWLEHIAHTAQPQRMRGRWVANSPVTMKCDQCGIVIKDWDWFRFKICPGCGARMENGGKAE